jgi:hypothetical protein
LIMPIYRVAHIAMDTEGLNLPMYRTPAPLFVSQSVVNPSRTVSARLRIEESDMPSCKRKWTGRLAVLAWSILAVLLTPLPATAQLAPVAGTHYAARSSDTGFQGAVNSMGGYRASVPLDLPAARGGLPVPVQIVYGGHRVGAAGLGWDVPLSYIFRDTTIAHRRPEKNFSDASPQAREQVLLMLDGQRIDLVRNAADTVWVARRNGAQLEVRDRGNGSMVMYDGEGRTYTFSAQGPKAGARLVGGKLFLLNGISAPDGNSVVFIYQFNVPALPGGGSGLAIDLLHVRFNNRLLKNSIYDAR